MNAVARQIMGGVIISAILIFVLLRQMIGSFRMWLDAWRRADELLRAVLSQEQYRQLRWQGYVDIMSPRDHTRFYRVPLAPERVEVIERERRTASLCLRPLESVPGPDLVAMHKLMIEADEETYLQTANRFPPTLRLDC